MYELQAVLPFWNISLITNSGKSHSSNLQQPLKIDVKVSNATANC